MKDLPEYDVFNDTSPLKEEKEYGDNDFIQYNEKTDFPLNQREKSSIDVDIEEHHTDYDDGFGVYKTYEKKKHNILTLLYFPVNILWLEITLRLCFDQPLFSVGTVYTLLFSMGFSCFFTLICTFADSTFNRKLANIILTFLTVFFILQMLYCSATGSFYSVTESTVIGFGKLWAQLSSVGAYVIALCIPLALSFIFGRFFFPFRSIRIFGKIFLVFTLAVVHITALGIIDIDSVSLPRSDTTYYTSTTVNQAQERFGLLTAQRLDISHFIDK